MVEDWGDLIKQMRVDMKKDEVRCYRSMRSKFDGTFMVRLAPNVHPQNFKFIIFVNVGEQKDDKAVLIDNSYGLGVSWKISKYGSLDNERYVFNIFTEHSKSRVFNLNPNKWNFIQVEVNTRENKFTITCNDSGPMVEEFTGEIRYSPKLELTLGGNKAGCFFIGEICYYGLWEI